MLKQALEQLMIENDIPLVWKGMGTTPYHHHRAELDSHRNDGKVSYEQEEDEDIDMGMEDDADMMDLEWDDEMMGDEEVEPDMDMDAEDDLDMDAEDEFGDLDSEDDPDRQGLIRTVPNTHMVYKRASEDGTFEELWIYNVGDNFDNELEARRGILSGTDINMTKMRSDDGAQSYEVWNAGNAQLLHITGLPS